MAPSSILMLLVGSVVLLAGVHSNLINPSLELPRNCYSQQQCTPGSGISFNNSHCNLIRSKCQCNFAYTPTSLRRPASEANVVCGKFSCSSDLHCTSTYGPNTACNMTTMNCDCARGYALNNETQLCFSLNPISDRFVPSSNQPIPDHINPSNSQPIPDRINPSNNKPIPMYPSDPPRIHHRFYPVMPVVPVVPVVPHNAPPAELGTDCGYNGKTCGEGSICWLNKCVCPVSYYPSSRFNCSKISCDKNTDCLVFEKHSYCSIWFSDPKLNTCECSYGVDFYTQRCAKQISYSTCDDNGYYSFMGSYICILVFVFLITLIATIIRNCRKTNKPRVTSARLQSPKQIPPPPYMTKA